MKPLRFVLNQRPLSRDGFIIVAVLWILGALATLATIYSVYVINTAVALAVHDERLQADALVSAAVEIAVYKMKAEPNLQLTRGRFSFRANRADVSVDFKSEAARIDLNAAPKALLAGLFTTLGARAEAADTYADRIIAWRSGPRPGTSDDEASVYRAAGLSYSPRLGPFPHTGELSLVLGLPPAMVERALPFVTVYSGQPQINLFDAAPEVIASLPGMTPATLQDVLAQRQSKSQNVLDFVAALGAARGLATASESKAVRVTVRVDFENGRSMRSEAVVLLHDGGNVPYSVLSWRDDIDEVLEEFDHWAGLAMTSLDGVVGSFGRWIDAVAATVTGAADRLTFPRKVELAEQEDGTFELRSKNQRASNVERLQVANGRVVDSVSEKLAGMLRGSRAELRLRPTWFLFRPIDLPSRASEFLDGVVRSQIDRLTPWSADDAAFGFGQPATIGPDRIVVKVAATARAQVEPYVQALAGAGVESITVTTAEGDAETPITVLEQRTRSILDAARVRRVLVAVLLLAGLVAAASVTSAVIIGHNLDAKQDELARRIAERRAALRIGGAQPALSALGKLELRKHESPASVIVIEALSQILPDHTYVTELRIEGDKLRVTGITRDAPSLIRLIEQSSQFTRATFFAPTTRAPSDPGDRFHIEAQIGPILESRS